MHDDMVGKKITCDSEINKNTVMQDSMQVRYREYGLYFASSRCDKIIKKNGRKRGNKMPG